MTVFEETFQEIDSFGKTFDETANKIRVLTEYVVSDYNVDVASVKLEQKKDDTITDAQVSESLYEVTEKCNGKLKKTMGSINRNSQDYFSKMNTSLQKITNDSSYQETIDKAGALCKEFPKLGKVEVTYHAYEEEAKAIAKGMDQLQTVISKGKARKNFTDADSAKIDEIINATNKARQAAGKKDNTVTLTEGVALLSALLIALKNQTAEKSTEKTEGPVDAMSPESSRIMLKAIGAQKQLAKSNVAVNTRGALSLRNGIKKAIKQKKSLEKAEAKAAAKEEKETKESTEELLDGDFIFEFSDEDMVSELDAAALLESVFEELHTEPTAKPEPETVTESAEELESSIQDHLSYMSQLENEILGFEATKEEAPAEDDIDRILTEAASDAEALPHSDPGDTDGPTAKEAVEDEEPEENPTEESVEDPEKEPETTEEPAEEHTEEPVNESEEPETEEEPEEKPTEESTEDDLDGYDRLDHDALESGITQEPETTEESVEESTEDPFDIDAMLTEAALNAGITPDSDEVDALCKKYGVTIESSDEEEE